MQLVDSSHKINNLMLDGMAEKMFGSLVKAVVDVEKRVMVIDAGLHSDQEQYLLSTGSKQKNLWGINLHPGLFGTPDYIEYDSMINIRPHENNMTKYVQDEHIRLTITNIVKELTIDI